MIEILIVILFLPFFAENSYYQLAPGRYIFPGAEVYSEPEDFDQCSLSANSESTDSDSDSSSGEEEEDEEEETCKFHSLFFFCQISNLIV